jgi:site-specific DNA recombinase
LHRRPIELEHFIDLADRHRLALATVSGDTDLGTDNGRLFARIKGAVAKAEVERKSARQRRAQLQKAQLGQPAGGPRAFGYQRDGITIREDEAEALRAAYAALLTGRSMVGIAKDLNAAGFVTARLGRRFNHSAARAVLINPRNAALRSFRGEIVGPAVWSAIVDEDTWYAAHALLTDDARRKGPGTSARKWLLGGLALCGRCDDGETTVKVTYRGERRASGELVRSYRCHKSPHLTREASFCEWRVAERVIARLSQKDARDLLIDDDREDLAELRREAGTLRLRLDQLAAAFGDGTIDDSQLHSGSERLRARLADLEARMAHVSRAPVLADLVTAEDVRAVWKSLGMDRQRAVVNLLYVVTLLPRRPGRGRTKFESEQAELAYEEAEIESVRMDPKA